MEQEPNQNELRRMLSQLPDARLSSNFTARVMAAVDLEELRAARKQNFWKWHALLPRIAMATVIVVSGGIMIHQHEISSRRAAIASSLALVAGQQMPSVEALKNFDAIQRMSQPARADDELIALLQ